MGLERTDLFPQTLRYTNPPDIVMTQLQVYLEERQEDQDELYERRKGIQANPNVHEPTVGISWLTDLAETSPARHASILDWTERLTYLANSAIEECVMPRRD